MNVFAGPLGALASFGEGCRFAGKIMIKIFNGRVLAFIGEAIRQGPQTPE